MLLEVETVVYSEKSKICKPHRKENNCVEKVYRDGEEISEVSYTIYKGASWFTPPPIRRKQYGPWKKNRDKDVKDKQAGKFALQFS